ncbi:MAG TPA: type II secretion system protein GspK [Pseudomonas sp.]|nr:type II secretion system protein GspK [Pseudomonas sp.]
MSRSRQRGLALVTVLLVMALLTLLVAGMLRSQQLLVAGVGQQLAFSRLLQLALAGEQQMLEQLARQAPTLLQRSHVGQEWAEHRQLALADGQLRMRMEDLAGRLNLTALIGRRSIDPVLLERWQRLCASLGIDPPDLQALVGQRLLDVSQLGGLPGMSADALERLRPWVVLLPDQAGLNVNTAPTRLLAALEGLGPAAAQRVQGERPDDGHASVQGFLASPQMLGLGTQAHGLAVASRWFRLELQAELDGQRMYLYSDFEIDAKTHRVNLVRRSFSATREQQRDE